MSAAPYTVDEVEHRLRDAATVHARLPGDGRPRGYGLSWPALATASSSAWLTRPSAQEIADADEAARWPSAYLDDEAHRRLICDRARGVPLRQLAGQLGVSHEAVRKRHRALLARIARGLNTALPPQRAATRRLSRF